MKAFILVVFTCFTKSPSEVDNDAYKFFALLRSSFFFFLFFLCVCVCVFFFCFFWVFFFLFKTDAAITALY